MNTLHKINQTVFPTIFKAYNNFKTAGVVANFQLPYSSKKKRYQNDDEDYKEPPSNKPYKIVQAKTCEKCSFWTWKPKLDPKPIKSDAAKKGGKEKTKPRKCYPGMKVMTNAEKRKLEQECLDRMKPTFKGPCKEKEKPKEVKKEKKKKPIPKADWNHSC